MGFLNITSHQISGDEISKSPLFSWVMWLPLGHLSSPKKNRKIAGTSPGGVALLRILQRHGRHFGCRLHLEARDAVAWRRAGSSDPKKGRDFRSEIGTFPRDLEKLPWKKTRFVWSFQNRTGWDLTLFFFGLKCCVFTKKHGDVTSKNRVSTKTWKKRSQPLQKTCIGYDLVLCGQTGYSVA